MKRMRACNFLDFSKFSCASLRKITKIVTTLLFGFKSLGVYYDVCVIADRAVAYAKADGRPGGQFRTFSPISPVRCWYGSRSHFGCTSRFEFGVLLEQTTTLANFFSTAD